MRIDLKHGLDVRLNGTPEQIVTGTFEPGRCALLLASYCDLWPVHAVAVGDRVALGKTSVVPNESFTIS